MSDVTRRMRAFSRVTLSAAVIGCAAAAWSGGSAWASDEAKESASSAKSEAPDRLVLRSGRVVNGAILEETDTQVVINVVVAGISAKTTFAKSEIAEIKRGANAVTDPALRAAKVNEPAVMKKGDPEKSAPSESAADEDDPTLTRLYVVEVEGRFGWDVSKSAIESMFREVDREFNDAVDGTGEMSGKTVVDPAKRDRNIVVMKLETFSEPQFGSIFQTEDIGPAVEHQMIDRGRRVVFWIESATGGAAVLPFVSPEIYFTPTGRLGGVVDLDEFKSGDHMVDEKLISAYIGHAQGFLVKGGYQDHIPALNAMLRKQNWLAVKFEGGRPVYIDHEPDSTDGEGWTILSDDGAGNNKDEQTLIGNDLFLLEPEWAEKLGISDGTVETIDDLAFRLGVQRHYKAIEENRGQKALEAWKDGLAEAIRNINKEERPGRRLGRLWREFNDIKVDGDYNERKRDRGRKINLLKEIRAIVSQYAEVLDPQGAGRSELDVDIRKLQLEAEEDARQEREQSRGPNNNRRRPPGL